MGRLRQPGDRGLRAGLAIGDREVVALVGAGGKTTAMFRLARELIAAGAKPVVTTTTRILAPKAAPYLEVVVGRAPHLRRAVAAAVERGHVPVVGSAARGGKIVGVPPDLAADLARLRGVTHVLVEADGAAGRPFKAPRAHEPVIPSSTTLVVAVVGVDAIGRPLRAVAHHVEPVTALTGLGPDDRVTARAIARVMVDPLAGAKGVPRGSRFVVLVNKADTPARVARARDLAAELQRAGAGSIVIASCARSRAVVRAVRPR